MFRKLREALKKQRYRVHSDDVALPEVHTGQVTHSDAPETPEKHKSITYENAAIPIILCHTRITFHYISGYIRFTKCIRFLLVTT